MQRTLLVARHDFLRHLRRPSFLITTLGMPLLVGLIFLFIRISMANVNTHTNDTPLNGVGVQQPIGYIDHSGLLASPAPELAAYLLPMADRAEAEAALVAGEIRGFYEFAADYLESGAVVWVDEGMRGPQGEQAIAQLVQAALLAEHGGLAEQLARPPSFQARAAPTEEALAEQRSLQENLLPFILPFAFAMALYTTIFSSAGFLLQSVTEEKENRTVEIILTSLRPWELLTGKVMGLGLLGLVQGGVWLGSGLLMVQLFGGIELDYSSLGLGLTWGTLAIMVGYYILGYLVYGSLLAAVGALIQNVREGSQFVFMLIIPSMMPLWFWVTLIERPNSLLAMALSLFPLSAPVTMALRVPITGVPAWEIGLSFFLLALTAAGAIWLASRIFRAGSLLSGQNINMRVFMRAFTRSEQA
ncbi:ABC transporter permease [Candidatus Viridilinea mediisalina]|uniref:ABC-2 type transporter transmembrane domain-containing protein n=1 Tax=Candidatus Viridilinea mediisalina TaxID=2024553 RepID=A0A2A6RK48_9CHLR|nr:ABC transporter permease [Candidatus Viridilinea mediisalina]PDW03266.1 hypothetical protein CJ255_09790 [Candidatus Viridilinea mediisalina]